MFVWANSLDNVNLHITLILIFHECAISINLLESLNCLNDFKYTTRVSLAQNKYIGCDYGCVLGRGF